MQGEAPYGEIICIAEPKLMCHQVGVGVVEDAIEPAIVHPVRTTAPATPWLNYNGWMQHMIFIDCYATKGVIAFTATYNP